MLQAAAAPVDPGTRWHVEYNANDCTVSRKYGDAQNAVTLAFQPAPGGYQGDMFVITSVDATSRARSGSGKVILQPAGLAFSTEWVAAPLNASQRIVRIRVDQEFWTHVSDAKAVTIKGFDTEFALPLNNIKSALNAAAMCGDDLLRHWGADPAAMIPPFKTPRVVDWIRMDDYPSAALSAPDAGNVHVMLRINPAGRPIDCRVVVSSGVPLADSVTCKVLARRVRVESGKPVVRYMYRVIAWRPPDLQ